MAALPPLPVVVPLLAALMVAATSKLLPRLVAQAGAIMVAAATTGISVALMLHAFDHRIVYWFSGWHPRGGVALGISFTIDALGAATAAFASLLVTAAFVFSFRYFEEAIAHRFTILALLFLGAMDGFALTGDLFNLFVWFELMSISAYALTAYKVEEPAPVQGALNFAFVNSAGGFALLLGIALLYGRTGALNMAQVGAELSHHAPDGLMIVAFTLVVAGLMVKGSIVPFHFWLSDAHAAAPTPICVLFSGIMVELGLYGVARVWWSVFDGGLGHFAIEMGQVMMTAGVLTAVVGALMCFLQQHIKRLLAFSTISHMGLFLIGFGLLSHDALAGSGIYVIGHGLVKASLFMCAGILLHRTGKIEEEELRARGTNLRLTGAIFALGGLALAEMPPFGTFLGKTLIEDAGTGLQYHWMPWVFALCSAVAGAAVLRVAGVVFLGWGPPRPRHDPEGAEQEGESETQEAHERTPRTMTIPALVLLAAGLGVGLMPGISHITERATAQFENRTAYTERVLTGRAQPEVQPPAVPPTWPGTAYGIGSAVGAVAIAAVTLLRDRAPRRLAEGMRRVARAPVTGVRLLHSGHVGDYLAWFTFGIAAFGAAFGLLLH